MPRQKFEIAKKPIVPPPKRIPRDQRWFWTERWQKAEREAQEDIEAGRVHRYANVDEVIDALEKRANG